MNLNKHKMIILCGGRGRRMGNVTKNIPKPMVKVGKIPILK
jgi:NDP-sugar pyrophosphorylase family protein